MTDKKQTITFTADVAVKDHTNKTVFSAKRGDVVKLNEASAARWLSRNKALPGEQAVDAGDAKPTGPTHDEQLQGADDAEKKAIAAVKKAQIELSKLSENGKTPDNKTKAAAQDVLDTAVIKENKAKAAVETLLDANA